ncbi:MAG: pyridoxine 5'-phosphate synthase, partial [Candidatus Omnitrophota bacterium]
ELTTEGGLDLRKHYSAVNKVVERLKEKDIKVSLFIDPVKCQVDLAAKIGVDTVEFNTGGFSESKTKTKRLKILDKLAKVCGYARRKGFSVAAGHGLDYINVKDILSIKDIEELNIGPSIISRSLFLGVVSAVEEMLALMKK